MKRFLLQTDLDDGDKESLFVIFMHGPTDGANSPAQLKKQQVGGNNRATVKQPSQLWPLSVKRESVQIEANNRQIVTACVQQTNSQNYGH